MLSLQLHQADPHCEDVKRPRGGNMAWGGLHKRRCEANWVLKIWAWIWQWQTLSPAQATLGAYFENDHGYTTTRQADRRTLNLHDRKRLVWLLSCLFLLKSSLKRLMLADSSRSCFENTEAEGKGVPQEGAIILTVLGLEQSKTKRSLQRNQHSENRWEETDSLNG